MIEETTLEGQMVIDLIVDASGLVWQVGELIPANEGENTKRTRRNCVVVEILELASEAAEGEKPELTYLITAKPAAGENGTKSKYSRAIYIEQENVDRVEKIIPSSAMELMVKQIKKSLGEEPKEGDSLSLPAAP